jgi:hypothetical protein
MSTPSQPTNNPPSKNDCDCIENVNACLVTQARSKPRLGVTDNQVRVAVVTESNKALWHGLVANFCPFCGREYTNKYSKS